MLFDARQEAMRTARSTYLVWAAFVSGLTGCGGSSGAGPAGPPSAVAPPMGTVAVTSEADAIMHFGEVRSAGYNGTGVKIGVISTGVVHLASYQAAGVLPASLYVTQNTEGALDEGSWMLELIHQHAPGATLGFCDGLDLDFHACINDLANNFHADIVVDDILFSGEYYPDATADLVAQVEASNSRFVFVHLSGNEQQGGYWRGPFVAVPASLLGKTVTLLDFGAASGGPSDVYEWVTVPPSAHLTLFLNWNDPPHDAANHGLTATLLDDSLNFLASASGQPDPNLRLDYTNSTGAAQFVNLAVALDSGSANGLSLQISEGSKTCNIECQPLKYFTSGIAGGTVGDFADALVVGATNAAAPHTLEAWSNHGPFVLDFSATADSAAPDGYDYVRLATPLQVNKPDLVSPDCVTVPFSDGLTLTNNQFCGTSASVPSIAAAAALLESAGFDRARVLKALRGTAVPLGTAAWDPGYGAGLADVAAAWKSAGL